MADQRRQKKGLMTENSAKEARLMDINEKIKELGFELPAAAAPAANYVPYMISGNMLFVSGQIPFLNGQAMHLGRLGEDLSIEEGVAAAQACALNILGQVNAAIGGDWSRIKQCLKLGGFVNCTAAFTDHPVVINGASDLIGKVLGERGRHTRFAVGAPSLPLGVAVEIEALFALTV